MIITGKSLPRRTFLKGVGAAVALPFLDSMVPAFAAPAKPPVRLAFLYVPNGIDMKNWNVPQEGAFGELPRIMKPLEAFRDDMIQIGNLTQQQRPRAARRRRRSRPLRRVLPHRRPGPEDDRRHQGEHLLRPDHRQQDRPRDALRVARARHGRFAPGRRLRLRLFLRLHQQPGVAQRDAAAAADPRSARAVRAAVRHRRRAEPGGHRSRRRGTAAASWTSSPATRRSCRRRSDRPTSASSTNTCRRFAKSSGSWRRRRRRASRSIPAWTSRTACRRTSPSTSS